MDKKYIIYVGNFSFPLGNASGKRVYGNGCIFRELGYETIFIGMDSKVQKETPLEETRKTYDGFDYYNLNYPAGSAEWLDFHSVFLKLTQWLDTKKHQIFAIVFYGSLRLSPFISKMINWARKNEIKTIVVGILRYSIIRNNTRKRNYQPEQGLAIFQGSYHEPDIAGYRPSPHMEQRYQQNRK